ncbi:MAG: bacteriohemerythrin [bacterium]|nr:bacteriohemerythrin [bacterium]
MHDTMIHWGSEYELGISQIDQQHRQLAMLINGLRAAMSYGDARPILGGMLEKLIRHATLHFQIEQRLLKEVDYPELEDHLSQHAELVGRVHDLHNRFKEKPDFLICVEIHQLLKNWLLDHDLKEDRRFVQFLKSRPET